MKKKESSAAWLVLAGVILIRGFAGGGINMTAGLFLSPVSRELGVGIGTLSVYFSITSVVLVAWLPVAGKLINRYDVRWMAVAAVALQALSFAALGLMNSVLGWYLLAIPQAMGAAFLVNLLGPILINRWFPDNTGFMLGIQMAFVGLFGAAMQLLASNLIAVRGWRTAYFFVGGVTFLAVTAAAFLLLRNRPPMAEAAGGKQGADRAAQKQDAVEIPEKEATHSASFLLLLIFIIAITGVAVFTQHIPTYGARMGYSPGQVGTALSLAAVGSATGAIAIGLICDRIGGLKTCFGIIGLWMLAIIGLLCSAEGFFLFAASAFLHGLVSSSITVIAPILTLIFYGKTDYEKIYAKVSMGAPLASILLIPAYGFIYDATNSYRSVLFMLLGLLGIAGAGIAVGWKKRCTQAGCPTWRKPR